MVMLVVGLLLFLGAHSIRVFADGWRTATIARVGEKRWKAIYSVVSIVSLVVLVWGYVRTRNQIPLWDPPDFMRYVTVVLMLPVFVIFVAARVPRNAIKAKVHHPQVLSVALWGFAHLLSNGYLADVLLFGAFLAWAILSFGAARQRDRAAGTVYPSGTAKGTMICVVAGLVIYAVFMLGLHRWLFGASPI